MEDRREIERLEGDLRDALDQQLAKITVRPLVHYVAERSAPRSAGQRQPPRAQMAAPPQWFGASASGAAVLQWPARRRLSLVVVATIVAAAIFAVPALLRGIAPPDTFSLALPDVRVELERRAFTRGDTVSGALTISARDAVRIEGAEAAIYPTGVPQEPGREVATFRVRLTTSELAEGASGRFPFVWDQRSAAGTFLPRGSYVLVVSVRAEADKGREHMRGSIGTAVGLQLE